VNVNYNSPEKGVECERDLLVRFFSLLNTEIGVVTGEDIKLLTITFHAK